MSILRRVANLFRRARLDREIEDELQSHIELAVEAGERSGLSPEEARRAAERQFGNALQIRERTVDADIPVALDNLGRDVRHALRQLRRSPVLTTTAVLTLALGIGATTAVYTLIEQVLLRPLPVAHADRLWRIGHGARCCYETGYAQGDWVFFPHDAFRHFRANTPAFEELAAFQVGKTDLAVRRAGAAGAAERRTGQYVSGSFFRTFAISAAHGRTFTDADDEPGASPVAVLSYRSWETDFGADPSVIGSTYAINGKPFTIIGVTPPGFYGVKLVGGRGMPDVWLPLSTEPLLARETSRLNSPAIAWLDIIGRARRGTRPEMLQEQLHAELQQWLAAHSADMTSHENEARPRQTLEVTPGGNGISLLGEEYEGALELLLIAAGCVLLIACANVANLLVARGLKDAHQMALRTALGASRARLVRKALTESVVLSACGAVAGVAVAYGGAALILRLAFTGADTWSPVSATPSLPVLGVSLALAFCTGIIFGITPAWLTTRADPMDAMRGTSRSVHGHRNAAQKTLVVFQVALSFVLISAATMLGRSVRNLENAKLGFETDGRYFVSINSMISGYEPEWMDPMLQEIQNGLRAIPGVRAATAALYAPMGGLFWSHDVAIDGARFGSLDPARDGDRSAAWTRVTPGFFETIGAPLVAGRTPDSRDNATAQRIAVVNESFARKYFGTASPLGERFGPAASGNASLYEIVGVVADMRYFGGGRGVEPMYYVPQAQSAHFDDDQLQSREVWSHYPYNIVVWAPGASRALEPDIRRVIGAVAPHIVVEDVQPYSAAIHQRFSQENMIATLSSLFGLISLLLAGVGLYGVIAYSVEQRTGEISVRRALGAQDLNVVGMILRDSLAQVGAGLVIGIPAAIAAGSMIANQLFGVTPLDGAVMPVAAFLLVSAGSVAALVPARRAAAVSPMRALRA